MSDLNRRGFLGTAAVAAATITLPSEPTDAPMMAPRLSSRAQTPANLQIQLLDGVLQSAEAIAKNFSANHLGECSCRYCRRKDADDRYWLAKDVAGIEYNCSTGASHLYSVMSGERYEIEASDTFGDHLRRLADLADKIDAMEIADEPVIVGQK